MLQPTNARPTTSAAPGQPLNPAPIYPAVTVVTDGKDSAWRHAPQARLMPDRWIAVLKSGATTIEVAGRDIARPLYVGLDPNPPPPLPPRAADDQLQLDPGMKWMVDFDEAEQKGMGLRITVPPAALSFTSVSASTWTCTGQVAASVPAGAFINLHAVRIANPPPVLSVDVSANASIRYMIRLGEPDIESVQATTAVTRRCCGRSACQVSGRVPV